ncbi:MAG: hypothetical protein V4539_02770 [Bacteroidota bacterium]
MTTLPFTNKGSFFLRIGVDSLFGILFPLIVMFAFLFLFYHAPASVDFSSSLSTPIQLFFTS